MKKITIIFVIFMLIFTSIVPIQILAHPQSILKNEYLINFIYKQKTRLPNSELSNDFTFNPQDIELKDDAFHGADLFNYAEWWYFDALFEDNYSVQITFYVFSVIGQKFIVIGTSLYRNGIGVFTNEKYYLFNDLSFSKEIPYIEIDGKQFMKGYIDETSGNWVYDISLDFEDSSIALQFIGKSKGWKGDLSIGGWAAILPKAEVTGKINLHDIEFDVVGIGYHDHNWGMSIYDLFHFGWYWGRIHSDNLTVVWFVILNTRFDGESLCVISREGDYININPKDIDFSAKDFVFDVIWLIPKSFALKVNSNNIFLSIMMNAESIDSDYKINGHYCRYHLNCLGNAIIDNQMMDISGTQIAEFMRMR